LYKHNADTKRLEVKIQDITVLATERLSVRLHHSKMAGKWIAAAVQGHRLQNIKITIYAFS
jgi:hypothetical protein